MTRDLLINVVGGLLVAAILFLLGRFIPPTPKSAVGGGSAVPVRLPAVRRGLVIMLVGGFALLATGINLVQPPPPFPPLMFVNRPLVDSDDLLYEAEEVTEGVTRQIEKILSDATADANDIMVDAAVDDSVMRSRGQTAAADAHLRVAESRAAALLETARAHANRLSELSAATAADFQSRTARRYGSVLEILQRLVHLSAVGLGTILRTLLLVAVLLSLASVWVAYSFDSVHAKAALILGLAATAVAVFGYAVAAELFVPFVAAGLASTTAASSTTPRAALGDALNAVRSHLGLALALFAVEVAIMAVAGYGALKIELLTLSIQHNGSIPAGVYGYTSSVLGALFGLELARAAVGVIFLRRLLARSTQADPLFVQSPLGSTPPSATV